MISYANQKLYSIEKRIKEGDVFIMVKWEDYCSAAKDLSPSALNLYMYLAKNRDGYEFYFSSKDYCKTFNVVDKTYRNAKHELERKGYLKEEGNKIRFSVNAAFKETIDGLNERFKQLMNIVKVDLPDEYIRLYEEMEKDPPKKYKDHENIYKCKVKEWISILQETIKEFTDKNINELL